MKSAVLAGFADIRIYQNKAIMKDNILQYSPWKIEQTEFVPEMESEIEKQLAFSNGYLSQYGFFEEYYSGEASAAIYLKGIESPLCTNTTVSVRLHEERLNVCTWKLEHFYRCLNRETLLLERRMDLTSPQGHHLEVNSKRQCCPDDPHFTDLEYTIRSVNYEGPMSVLPLIGGPEINDDWYPLQTDVALNYATLWLQSRKENVQVVMAISYEMEKNGRPVTVSPIRIEKKFIVGYSLTEHVKPGDTITLKARLYVTDSRNYPLSNLQDDAVAAVTENAR